MVQFSGSTIALNNRANVVAALGGYVECLKDYDKAVAIFTSLVEQDNWRDLAANLGGSLNGRGKVLRELNRRTEAFADFDKAVGIYTRLVEQEGRIDLADSLAMMLSNRGLASRELGKVQKALADYDKSLTLYKRLVDEDGCRAELSDVMTISLSNRGKLLLQQAKRDEAASGVKKPQLPEPLPVARRLARPLMTLRPLAGIVRHKAWF